MTPIPIVLVEANILFESLAMFVKRVQLFVKTPKTTPVIPNATLTPIPYAFPIPFYVIVLLFYFINDAFLSNFIN